MPSETQNNPSNKKQPQIPSTFKTTNNILESNQIPSFQTNSHSSNEVLTLTSLVSNSSKKHRVQTNDNKRWGDDIEIPPGNDHTRIYFQNVNSINNRSMKKWDTVIQSMKSYNVSIFGLAETCVDWNNPLTKSKFAQKIKTTYPFSVLSGSCNHHNRKSKHQPGGTITATLGQWTARSAGFIQDPRKLGRWSGIRLRLKADHELIIITGYRVCKQDVNSIGPNTSSSQQYVQLRSAGITNSCPRQQFIEDLSEEINKLTLNPNTHLILMLDGNEVIGDEPQGIIKLMEKTKLVDVFPLHHGKPCNISTCSRAESHNRRIDYILASANITKHIKKCGYLPFYQGIISDHRGVFIDISNSIIDKLAELKQPPSRMISSKSHYKDRLAYKKYLIEKFNEHLIFDKAQKLAEDSRTCTNQTEQFKQQLFSLDEEITKWMKKSETINCKKRAMPSWSVEIATVSEEIKYWIIASRGHKNNINVSDILAKLRSQLSHEAIKNIDQATGNPIKELRRSIKRKQKLIVERRKEYKINNPHAPESSKRLFNQLKNILKSTRNSGISHIEIPNPEWDPSKDINTQWIRETNPQKIEEYLLKRNTEHFGQAESTPFCNDEIRQHIGYTGSTIHAETILQGHIPEQLKGKCNTSTTKILQKLSDGHHLPTPKNEEPTFDEFKQGLKKWKEQTSTSPSNRHLGHYKVLLLKETIKTKNKKIYNNTSSDYNNNDTSAMRSEDGNEINELNNKCEEILKVYYNVMIATFNSGLTLPRWCQSTTLMIEKIPGCPRIDKLRVIHLYEADYNLGLRIYWSRKAVWNAHISGSLDDSQAGSRPGKRCIDVVIQKELKFLYSRLTRTPMATVDNDAKSCYDRIACNLATLASRYHGVSFNVCKTHATTLEMMKYKIRTAIGDSKNFYANSDTTKIHGTGQGSSASPSIWLMISVLLIKILKNNHNGMRMMSVDKNRQLDQIIEGFVDDTSLYINAETNNMDDIMDKLQRVIQEWNDLLCSSGGKLELPKCFYYRVEWDFNSIGEPIPKQLPPSQPITITCDLDKTIGVIEEKHITQSHKTLGVLKNLTGDETEQLYHLQQKSDNFSHLIVSGYLSRKQARTAHSAIYMPSMLYSITASNHSEAQLNLVQQKTTYRILPCMGYERTFPRAIVNAPISFGGMNLGNLYVDGNYQKINTVISHIRANTELGQQILITLEWTQLLSGLSTPILACNRNLEYMTNNWFISIQQFLTKISGTITINNTWIPTSERQGDKFLMDEALKQNMSLQNLKIINNWRIYYRVLSISDMANEEGTHIVPYFLSHPSTRNHSSWNPTIQWPHQEKPDKKYFPVWKNFIITTFSNNTSNKLKYKLGPWIASPHNSRICRQTYYSKDQHSIYIRQNEHAHFLRFEYKNQYRYQSIFSLVTNNSNLSTRFDLPDDCVPIQHEIKDNHNITVKLRTCPEKISRVIYKTTQLDEFHQFMQVQPQWQQLLLKHHRFTNSIEQTRTLFLESESLLAASDGGYDNGKGSFGAVIATNEFIITQTDGDAPGQTETHSSFRSECYGILGALNIILLVQKFLQIRWPRNKTLKLYCDNEGLIIRLTNHTIYPMSPRDFLLTDSDVELQILNSLKELKQSGIDIRLFHVKSHQDDTTPYDQLSRPAQLNVLADKLASVRLHSRPTVSYYNLPACIATLTINNQIITAGYKYFIRNAALSPQLRSYMVDKFKWEQSIPEKIWWKPHGSAMTTIPEPKTTRIRKWIFNHLPTNQHLARIHQCDNSLCQSCKLDIEDNDHIVRCTHNDRKQIRKKWLEDLYNYLDQQTGTHKEVTRCIMRGVTNWLLQKEPQSIEQISYLASETLRQAYNEQTHIGWGHFLRGRLSNKWRCLVQHSCEMNRNAPIITNTKKRRYQTPEGWAKGLILLNWNFVNDLWEKRNAPERMVEITDTTPNQETINTIDTQMEHQNHHYYVLQQAYQLIDNHHIHNQKDRDYILKSHEELARLTLHQLQLWTDHIKILSHINKLESLTGNSRHLQQNDTKST